MSVVEQFNKSIKLNLEKLDRIIDEVFNQAGIVMVETTRDLQDKNQNYASRRLSNLTNYRIKETSSGKSLSFGSNAANKGYNYGLVQEFGRKPGAFPGDFLDLYKWVEAKIRLGHITLDSNLGKTMRARIGNFVFLTALKIKNKGIKGKFYYRDGFLAGNKIFQEKLGLAFKREFK